MGVTNRDTHTHGCSETDTHGRPPRAGRDTSTHPGMMERHWHTQAQASHTYTKLGAPSSLGGLPQQGPPLLAPGPPRLRLGPGEVGDRLAGRESLPRCWVLSPVTWKRVGHSSGQGLAQRRVMPAHRHSRPAAPGHRRAPLPSGPCYPIFSHAQARGWTTRASQV